MTGEAWHVTSQYPPATLGGLGTHVAGLTSALHGRIAVRVLAPRGARGSRAPLVRLPPEAYGPGCGESLRAALHGLRPPAVLHVHNYECAEPACFLAEWYGCPLVTTVHLAAPETLREAETRLLAASSRVIAVSEWQAEHSRERHEGLHCVVIHGGVDCSRFRPPRTPRRERSDVLFAGRHTPEKGLDVALEAFALVRDPAATGHRLRIAGDGPWNRAYRNLARRLGATDRVDWLGRLPADDLAREYRRCAAFLMPSRAEPFGLAALEAMASGTPVIAACTGGLREIVADGVNGFHPREETAAAYAEALGRVLSSPGLAAELAAGGRRTAERLSWERCAGATLSLYDSLALPDARREVPA